MTTRATWPSRIGLALLWLAVTVGIAFLVARAATSTDEANLTAPLPPVAATDRATATLSEQTIAPVVSGDGTIMRDPDAARWLLVAPATSADVAYRLLDPPVGVKALIDGGPAGFDCSWAGLGLTDGNDAAPAATPAATPVRSAMRGFVPSFAGEEGAPGSSTGGSGVPSGGVTMRCAIPDDVRVVTGLTGTMVLQMAEPTTAMALPVSAVVGSAEQGQVVVVGDDGATSVRDVQLGVADTFWIEITGGLVAGEQVLEFPTQYDLRPGVQ